MIHPLTPHEKAELNAWIAEHVYGYKVQFIEIVRANMIPNEYSHSGMIGVPDYAGDWAYAGPLFERYPYLWLQKYGNEYYAVFTSFQHVRDDLALAQGTTGPEAIAKAVRAYEEGGERER